MIKKPNADEECRRLIDNRLLGMIQRNFPSLPLDGAYTDWDKWLRFARAAFYAGVAHENDACAAVCDAQAEGPECPERARYCAEAIRLRRLK